MILFIIAVTKINSQKKPTTEGSKLLSGSALPESNIYFNLTNG